MSGKNRSAKFSTLYFWQAIRACFLFVFREENTMALFASGVVAAIWLLAGFAMVFAIKNG